MDRFIKVIGAGLAGCEAALQITKHGIPVRLFEMKPGMMSPAHRSPSYAELVCSNSFKSMSRDNASGLLKMEMERLGSAVLQSAMDCRVEAGNALAVDRDLFSGLMTRRIQSDPMIEVVEGQVDALDVDIPTVVATGPLTGGGLTDSIMKRTGRENLYFFDAASPVVSKDSIDLQKVYFATRYDKGDPDYINCPMDQDEYGAFHSFLLGAKTVPLKDFEDRKIFEGCMPVEVMAKRGYDTLRFGPMRPVGLTDPHTGRQPFAVVQLRKDNKAGTLYNLVGFQTNLLFGEQKKLLELIPGLGNATIHRYGVMHKNTYINSPALLNCHFQMRAHPDLFFAGQITGVEGYLESSVSGIVAGLNASRRFLGRKMADFTIDTLTGALQHYVSDGPANHFQPMNANYGILKPPEKKIRKQDRKSFYMERSLARMDEVLKSLIL
ncbi:MAG: methylenetetrahydrofolate--tRNA-(uracil(54)-C(5))-methyltransferase (FADH(2)-oxidizing) TrmFO [Clostridia bacterium]